jgi:hypothetical protein
MYLYVVDRMVNTIHGGSTLAMYGQRVYSTSRNTRSAAWYFPGEKELILLQRKLEYGGLDEQLEGEPAQAPAPTDMPPVQPPPLDQEAPLAKGDEAPPSDAPPEDDVYDNGPEGITDGPPEGEPE